MRAVERSLITLNALTYKPSGGFVTAPTTSLPEKVGGMTRRIWTYPAVPYWAFLHMISTVGAFLLAGSTIFLFWNFLWSRKYGLLAGGNPWEAWTLEWATCSPPPVYNFAQLPPVHGWMRQPRIARSERLLGAPVVAWCAAIGTMTLWHFPVLYNCALAHEPVHILQHLSFLVTATMFWWPVRGPLPERRPSAGITVLYLFAAVLGIIIALCASAITRLISIRTTISARFRSSGTRGSFPRQTISASVVC